MSRPPKPEKHLEYTLVVRWHTNEETQAKSVVFEIRTTREFESFQYLLNVDADFKPESNELVMRVGGVSVPADLMPGNGPAFGGYEVPDMKPGVYKLTIKKAPKDASTFMVTVAKSRIAVEAGEVVGREFVGVI